MSTSGIYEFARSSIRRTNPGARSAQFLAESLFRYGLGRLLDGDPRVAVNSKRVMVRNCDYAAFRGKARSRHAKHEGVPVYGV